MKPEHKQLLVAVMLLLVFGPVLLVHGLRGRLFLEVCGDIKQGGDALVARVEAHKAQHGVLPDLNTIFKGLSESSPLGYSPRDDGTYTVSVNRWFEPVATYDSKDGRWHHMYDWLYQCGEVREAP